ncbi:MAG TPA: carbonic anhydrase [Patescibacteria group bacterium]|nr:carbonic anhydrase [Patescibacteria group bacterium]
MSQAQAVALSCIDFRFRKPIAEFFENELNIYAVDHMAQGGGVKMILEDGPIRQWTFENFDIAFNKHDVKRVILINHQDCGAYGGSGSFNGLEDEVEKQEIQLRHGVSVVQSKYPDKQVEAYLALLADDGKVTFKKVV